MKLKSIVLVLGLSLPCIGIKAQTIDSAGRITSNIDYITSTQDSMYMF
jgi:hypothetical protein